MHEAHRQGAHEVRFEWGLSGAQALAAADVVVLVDVLSFTTTLSVALDRGTEVWPYRWRDTSAVEHAARHDAVLAVDRPTARAALPQGGGEFPSLSPASLRRGTAPPRLVLPSPNGSTIAFALAGRGPTVLAACLRNATAVAGWIDGPRHAHPGGVRSVAVIAAGERWPDGGLRPAVEDLWGAGAVISALAQGRPSLSPEAEVARAAHEGVRGRETEHLTRCASGQELVARGYQADVHIAAEIDTSTSVPLLVGQRFVNAAEETARRWTRAGPGGR